MKKPQNYFTLMFVPEDNGKTFTLRIPKFVMHSALFFVVIFVSGMLLLLYKSGEIAAQLQVLTMIRMENEKLTKENNELRLVAEKIHNLDLISRYLERLAAPPAIDASLRKKPEVSVASSVVSDNIGNEEVADAYESASMPVSAQGVAPKSDKIGLYPNIAPVEGWITRQFRRDSAVAGSGHLGVDFAAAYGTPIKATAPGVVGKIENDKYFGLIVTLIHDNGFTTRYGHCSQVLVSKHDRVHRGQAIALVGNTGRSTAPHLHYEVIKDDVYIDPMKHIIGQQVK